MQVKLITGFDGDKFESLLNNFLLTKKNQRIIDVKFTTMVYEGMTCKYALVMYE